MTEERHNTSGRTRPGRKARPGGFTLVEMTIVVLILAIVSMVVLPKFAEATDEARESALQRDLQICQKQIEQYILDHKGRNPAHSEMGVPDDNFVARMTGHTDESGRLNNAGAYGPYMIEWPTNPYVDSDATAAAVKVGGLDSAPRDDTSGWYFSLRTFRITPNSIDGAPEYEPAEDEEFTFP